MPLRPNRYLGHLWMATLIVVVLLTWVTAPEAQEPGQDTKPPPKEAKPAPSSLPYEYSSGNRPDPFVPFKAAGRGVLIPGAPAAEEAEASKSELSLFDLNQFRLTGMVKKGSESWAILTTPEGKGIFVTEGMKVGKEGAVVTAIIFEDHKTAIGVMETRKMLLKVPFQKEGGQMEYQEIEVLMESSKAKRSEAQ